mmetsp:Transcript_10628/g.26644  ORF Transcript_10628/g.26644 Transcript_10628/m.26644 type:complete len:86 (+) Transcript_10628:660-917(+)
MQSPARGEAQQEDGGMGKQKRGLVSVSSHSFESAAAGGQTRHVVRRWPSLVLSRGGMDVAANSCRAYRPAALLLLRRFPPSSAYL